MESTVSESTNSVGEGRPPAPSPLTGCYLLIVVGEPHSQEHKDIILQRMAKGFLSWDKDMCHIDLEKELQTLTAQAPEGEEARYGERLIQYASENLVTEVLIHPSSSTLIQCIRNLLSSFTRHRHIIHAGYTFAGNGSWILQDGTFSYADFCDAFQEHEVQRVIRAYENTVTIDIHCASEGEWTKLPNQQFTKYCQVRVNPNDVLTAGSPSIMNFIGYISPFLVPSEIDNILESSDVVGNIRFSHPTLYVFPGGQGDAALFGINGFNMLVDGGFARKACFWDFVRHLDRLDAVLLTRINNSNICGISSVLQRKRNAQVYPQIGHFFCNIQDKKSLLSPDGDKDKDPLLVNLINEGHEIVSNLRLLNLRPQSCYRDAEPINLYHKVGHGTLDMYVLSPAKDSKEVREFIQKWYSNDQNLFSNRKDAKDSAFPLQNLVSICALLVWQPANPSDTITRILFPGSTPQHKIFEGLDKLKHLEFLKYPVCSTKTLTPSDSIASISKAKQAKTNGLLDKIIGTDLQKEKSPPPLENKQKSENKLNMENKQRIISDNKRATAKQIQAKTRTIKDDVKKSESIESDRDDSLGDNIKMNGTDSENETNKMKTKGEDEKSDDKTKYKPKVEHKSKIDTKFSTTRGRTDSKYTKSTDRKSTRNILDKKSDVKSSPTTPKKSVEPKVNGVVKEKEQIKMKSNKLTSKPSPTATPAKSAKEANNRKVLESKNKVMAKRDVSKPPEKKDITKSERKPISRRPKGTSPARKPSSPAKSTKPIPRSEKDSVIRKLKLEKEVATDSSTVSTPSADQEVKKLTEEELEAIKAQELADLKEEQEAVKEIEAVFSKDEKRSTVDSESREVVDETLITESEENEEYIIIEKEEVDQFTEDSINEQESAPKEDEIQKHLRDSEESEKQRRGSDDSKEANIEIEIKEPETEAEPEPETKEEPVEEPEAEPEAEPEEEEVKIPKEKSKSPEEVKLIEDESCKVIEIITPECKTQLQQEVQEIIESATDIVKSKEPADVTPLEETKEKTEEMSKEISITSPEDKIELSSEKKQSDGKDIDEGEQKDGQEANYIQESQPDEKFSATVESGQTTTAPTLPEDERITLPDDERIQLDEIKEDQIDQVIEEKHVKEETKERDFQVTIEPTNFEPKPPMATIGGMQFESHQAHQAHLRDIVKTPDEVADLPVHEEADGGIYDEFAAVKKSTPSSEMQDKKHDSTDKLNEADVMKTSISDLQDDRIASTIESSDDKLLDKSDTKDELDSLEKDDDVKEHVKEAKIIDDDTKPSEQIETKDVEAEQKPADVVEEKDEKGEKEPTEKIKTEDLEVEHKPSEVTEEKDVQKDQEPAEKVEETKKEKTPEIVEEEIIEKDKPDETTAIAKDEKEEEKPTEIIKTEESVKDEKVSPQTVDKEVPADEKPSTVDEQEVKPETDLEKEEKIEEKDEDHTTPEAVESQKLEKEQPEETIEIEEISKGKKSPEIVVDKPEEKEEVSKETIDDKEIPKDQKTPETTDDAHLQKEPQVEEIVEVKEVSKLQASEPVHDKDVEEEPQVEETIEKKEILKEEQVPKTVDEEDLEKEPQVEEKVETKEKTPETVDDEGLDKKEVEETETKDLPTDRKTPDVVDDKDVQEEEKVEEKIESIDLSKDRKTPEIVDDKKIEEKHIEEKDQDKDLPEDQKTAEPIKDIDLAEEKTEEKVEKEATLKDEETPEVVEAKDSEKEQAVSKDLPEDQQISTAPGDESVEKDQDVEEKIEAKHVLKDQKTPEVDDEKLEKEKQVDEKIETKDLPKDELTPEKDSIEEDSLDKDKHDKEVEKEPTVETKEIDTKQPDVSIKEPVKDEVPSSDIEVTEDHEIESAKAEEEKHVKTKVEKEEDNQLELRKSEEKETVDVKDVSKAIVEEVPCVISEREGMQIELKESYIGKQSDTPTETKTIDDEHISDAKAKSEEPETDEPDKKSPKDEKPERDSSKEASPKLPTDLGIEESLVVQTLQKPAHPELVTVTPDSAPESPMFVKTIDDKIPTEQSAEQPPKETCDTKEPTEEFVVKKDVEKIVASVAHVLKSDAPLSEFDFVPYELKGYTTELRETHITTVESPIREDTPKLAHVSLPLESIPDKKDIVMEISPRASSLSFITEERRLASLHLDDKIEEEDEDVAEKPQEKKVSSLIEDSKALMQKTSQMISEIKLGKESKVEPDISTLKEVEEPIIEEHLTEPEESEYVTDVSAKDKLSELKESLSSVMDLDSKIAHMVETQIETSLHTETQVPSTQEISSSSQDQITIDAKPDAKDIPDTTKDDATDAVTEEDVVEEKITPVQTSTLAAEKPEVCEKPETVDTVAETLKEDIEEEPTSEKITPVTKERSESPKEPSVEISQKEKDKTVDVTEKDVCVSKSTEEICEKTTTDELSAKVVEEIESLVIKQVELTKLELVPKQEETISSEDTDDKIPHADIGDTKQTSEEDISTVSALDKTEKSPEEESSTDDSQKKQDDSVITQQSEVCVSTSASETSELPTKDETEMSKEEIKEPEVSKLPADKITTSVEVHDVASAPEDAKQLEVTDTKETEVIDKEPEEVTKSEKDTEKPASPVKDSNEISMELCTDEHVTSHASELSEKSPTEKFLTEISEKEQDKLLTAKQTETDSKQEDEKPSKVQDEPISNEVSVSPDTQESTSTKEQVISDKDDKEKEPVEEEILVPKKVTKVETDVSTKSSPEDASPEKKDDDVKEQLEEVKEDTITKTTIHETQIIKETAYECTDVLDKDIVSDIVETVSPDSKSLVEETEKIPPTEISSLSGNEPLTSDLIEDSLTEITKSDLSEKSDVKEDSPEKQLSEHSDSKDTKSDLDETSKDTAILSKDEEHDPQKELPGKRDSTTSQSEEIVSKLLETQSDKSGKSSPDIKESVSSTHDLEIPSKDTSRKTTPEKELSNVESNVSIKSGTASPDIKFDESEKSGEISSAEKDEKDVDTKSDILSEEDNKDKSEVAEQKEEQPVKDSSLEKADDEKHDSDKSKEPSIERESPAKSDIVSETSDKLESIPPRTPDRISAEKEIHTLVSDLKSDVSGKSTPELKPDDIHDKAKSDESRKSTPDITKEESSILDSIKSDISGKSTPDMKKDESALESIKSDVSEKSSIVTKAESIEDIPVSTTKAKSEEKDEISIEKDIKKDDKTVEDATDDKLPVEEAAESDSDEVADILSSEIERKSSAHSDIDDKQKTKESTPDSVAEKEDTGGEHVKHAEKLPNISIDSPVKGSEASPTHIYELTTAKYATGAPEILSKKTDLDTKLSVDIDNLSPQQISGRSTPEIKIDLAVDIKQDDSSEEEVIPETPTKIVDSKTDMEKTDEKPDTPEKELEKDTDLVTPGPSSVPDVPDSDHSKDSTKISTENLSGKSTPDIADVEKIKEMHDISKYEKHIPGKSTPPTAPVSPLMKEKDVFSLEEMRKSESPVQRISPDIDDTTQRKSSKDLDEHPQIEDSAASKESVQDSLSGVSTPDVKSLSPIHMSSENITKSATSSIEKISHIESHSPELSSSSNIEMHQTSETTEIRDVTTETTVKEVESERKIETSKTTTIESTEKVTEKADEHSTISIETSTKIISEKESSDISETKSSTTTSVFTESLKSEQTKALEDKSTSVTKDIIEDTMSSVVTEKVETVITKDPVTDVTTTITSIKTTEVRSSTPGSDDYEVSSPPSDISSGQMSRVPNVWGVGSSEERQVYSDEDDMPGSPTSITSQVTHSPTTQFGYDDEKSTFDLTRTEGTILEKKVITGPHAHKHDTMSTSFYGALPAETDESVGSAVKTQSAPIPISGKSGRFLSDVSETSGEFQHHAKTESRFLDDADLDFDKAMSEHRQARGADLMKTSTVEITTSKSDGATTKVIKTETEQIHRNGYDKEAEDIEVKEKDDKETVTKIAKEKAEKIVQDASSSQSSTETKKDPIESWGKPLGLPSPAPPSLESNKTTPKKERKNVTSILAAKNRLNDDKRRSDSPGKYDKKFNKKPLPIYMDLTYVPHHGNSNYSYVDFFKRIRARYYVFSGTEPSKEVYNALLEAKQTWEDKELEVTIIPTYDTDVLGYWVAENEELLAKNKIDLSPSASRCTINLQDHETSCSAYRLEF